MLPKTMQNGAYDSAYLIRDMAPPNQWLWDSMLLWWSKFMEFDKDLGFISSVLLDDFQYWKDDIKGQEIDEQGIGRKATTLERYWRYNALDCRNTLIDTLYLLAMMRRDEPMQRVYQDVYMRCLSGLGMAMRGVKADFLRREWHRKQLESDRDAAVSDLQYMLADSDFNYNSPKQKSALLYDFMGLRPRNDRGRFINPNKPLVGNNAPSSGAIPLKLAKTEHPLFKKIIEQLEAAMTPDKQISNVCNMRLYSDRFRCTYSAAGTTTTRFSTKGSAFWDCASTQNIRKDYRDWFVADKNYLMLDVDYSQSDDVFVAYESEDPDKIALVESGKDGHSVHGEMFFGVPYDEIVQGKTRKDPKIVHPTKGIRQISKRVVHGTNFQMAAMTLYVTMGREAVVSAAELLGFKDAERWDQDKLVMLCGSLMTKYRRRYKRLNKNEWYKDIAQ
jgi:DNA polymerase I-like protein with 3'-5' exonuclease and polymerase domains